MVQYSTLSPASKASLELKYVSIIRGMYIQYKKDFSVFYYYIGSSEMNNVRVWVFHLV